MPGQSSRTSRTNVSSSDGNYWMLLEYALQRELLLKRWPWYASFLAYLDNERRQIREINIGGKFDSRAIGWSANRMHRVWYEMPTVVQDGVKALFGKDCFKNKKFVDKFLKKFPDYDLRMRV